MKQEFISYNQALDLKDLGFDEPCITSYNESGKLFKVWEDEQVIGITKCLAPLYQQAFRWLMEEYGVYGIIHITNISKEQGIDCEVEICGLPDENGLSRLFKLDGIFKYQEAQDACLNKLIEIVKDGKHV